MKNKKIVFPILFSLLIIFLSTIFHYQIYIEDAITNSPVAQYGISISTWRIVFEPFVGLLLFFNRAIYSLDELPILLIWIVVGFFIYSIINTFFIKEKREKKRFLISQIINLPLAVGLWFTFFVTLIFIPLPNNTIVNNSTNTILVTTHSHTEYSHDGLISQKDLWAWHKRNGFNAFFITDHNNHAKTLEFVKSQRDNKFPSEPLVMCGEEFSGSNHLSLLGLKRNFITRGKSDSVVIDSVRANNGAVIVNHWFDGEKKSLEYFKNLGVDGFEIINSATERSYDRKVFSKIKKFCKSNSLILNAGLDFHGYGNVCSIWNAMEIPNWKALTQVEKEDAIIEVLSSRNQSKIKPLSYNDRKYYDRENLFFSPIKTLINYFRTLNISQIISWLFWILLFSVTRLKVSKNEKFGKYFSSNILVPVSGLLGGLLMLRLALAYYLRDRNVADFTEMYGEYSEILLYAGMALFLYSVSVSIIRIRKIYLANKEIK